METQVYSVVPSAARSDVVIGNSRTSFYLLSSTLLLRHLSASPSDSTNISHSGVARPTTWRVIHQPTAMTSNGSGGGPSNVTSSGENYTDLWSPDDFWNSSGNVSTTTVASPTTTTLGFFAAANISIGNDTGADSSGDGEAKFCDEWEAAQHSLFQTANIFFLAAFLVPRSFKQSILLFRALITLGFFMATIWAGVHVCAPDALTWNIFLTLVNVFHTTLLVIRFFPSSLTEDLEELYVKLFKPLKVSKKHFKELSREGKILTLEPGESYALEELTQADERLSILLKGKMRVTCDETHLHYISPHEFIDSPEWEANHEKSDDVFQVTITAEQDCMYICWPRLKLERVLRHRPLVKIVLANLIGKDITQKLYSLNEHLGTMQADLASKNPDPWRCMSRCMSMDAVHTGTKGNVRSTAWRQTRKNSPTYSDQSSPARDGERHWVPIVANHFPVASPFTNLPAPVDVAGVPGAANEIPASGDPPASDELPPPEASSSTSSQVVLQAPLALIPVIVPVLAPPPSHPQTRIKSVRRREVKFETPEVKDVFFDTTSSVVKFDTSTCLPSSMKEVKFGSPL